MSASLCGGSQTASACRCSANSPFRWAESYKPGSSFAMAFQRKVVNAKSSTNAVETQRAEGVDPGFISGMNTPMHRLRPADKKAWAEQQVSKLLKPAAFTVYSKAKAAKQGAA